MKGQTGKLGVRGRSLLTAYLLGLRPPTIALEYDLDYSRRLTWQDYKANYVCRLWNSFNCCTHDILPVIDRTKLLDSNLSMTVILTDTITAWLDPSYYLLYLRQVSVVFCLHII